jgi:hypothetical protein
MAPKAAMKAAMKAAPASASSSKAVPTSKAMEAKGVKKDGLTKKSLSKLGSESLQDKLKRAVQDTSTPEDAAVAFKSSLSKLEHSKIWGQHKTYLKNNPSEVPADASKKDKGIAAALWYIQSSKGSKFMNVSHTLGGSVTVKKSDKWLSEKAMLDLFGQQDFEAHVASGRIIWRECPMTRGTYEYKDQNDIQRETTTVKGKLLTRGQEAELDDDMDAMFEELYNQDFISLKKITYFLFYFLFEPFLVQGFGWPSWGHFFVYSTICQGHDQRYIQGPW